ncbi:hypothetical protein C9374_002444 [Naegleria lovaniensis]|uniref:RGS domain-containing protein n=1 Tax=Naegleria lovaniensis TaxID=51637 RepID=A0AA88GTP3_NAELO|nr:uncharacterized protein C9374_002444 [Naegleria lovaniensis]KAG2386700.1 hypothetical protein C9374_002444 [Naegleria lovaniensis]
MFFNSGIFTSSTTTTATTNNTLHSLNDTSVCHPLLLAQGNKSEVGLCDDHVSARVIAAVVLMVHTCLLVVSFGGLVYKLVKLSKNQSSQKVNFLTLARNPTLIVIGCSVGYACTFVMCTRILIGRKSYPCFIFTLVYYFCIPWIAGTTLLRFIRLIVLSWLNSVKMRIGKRELLHVTEKDMLLVDAKQSTGSNMTSLSTSGFSGSQTSVASSTNTLTRGSSYSLRMEDIFKLPKDTDVAATGDMQDEDVILKKDTLLQSFEKGRLIELLRFSVSSKFIYLFYGIITFIHVSIYLIIGGIDYYNFVNGIKTSSTNSRQAFVVDTYIFSPGGCGTGSYNTNIFISFLAIYAAFGALFAIIALLMKKDIWFVKIEIGFLSLNWIFFALLYGIPSLFSQITTLVDYYFPWVMTILFGCIADLIMSCFVPVFIYQKVDRGKRDMEIELASSNNSKEDNVIRKILTNSKWNALFLQFSEKSFASEDVMMWHAVEQFKKVTSEKLRIELFLKICDTYLRIGAPLELNIPRKDFGVPEIMALYTSLRASRQLSNKGNSPTTVTLPPTTSVSVFRTEVSEKSAISPTILVAPNIFDRVQICCEHNMLDNYTRFEAIYSKQLASELNITSSR